MSKSQHEVNELLSTLSFIASILLVVLVIGTGVKHMVGSAIDEMVKHVEHIGVTQEHS